jgi:hypothetical protein
MTKVDARKAVTETIDYLKDLGDLVAHEFHDLRLEELELSGDGELWLVTLGYNVPDKRVDSQRGLMAIEISPQDHYKREYKIFQVNVESGEVQSMKIRLF